MGVTVKSKRAGNGTYPKKGDRLDVHYTGYLSNGEVFDSSLEASRGGFPFVFNVGMGQVIKGWDEGFMKVSVGEKATLTCTPDFAYGDRAVGPIPPNSTLTFEVELLAIGGPGTGQKQTMWNRSVGLFVVSFFTLIVMWALYDLLTENVFWGDSLAHLLGDSRFSEAFGTRSKEDEL